MFNDASTWEEKFDVVIVGAGTAGCLVANRLSQDPNLKVLLLEVGPASRSVWLKVPAGVSRILNDPRFTRQYLTEREPNLNNRAISIVQGNTLGGTSAINGMAYIRGRPDDYDHWRDLGNPGWAWADVLPYFRKSEAQQRGASEYHGIEGELCVTDAGIRHACARMFVDSGVRAGLPLNDDFNGENQEGIGFLQHTIFRGERETAATAFLGPAMVRANLHVRTRALVERLEIAGGAAVAVLYQQGGRSHRVKGRQFVLSGGSINSPKILMLSGIGPGDHLKSLGINVVVDLPGVGRNLHDHPVGGMVFATKPGASLNARLRFPGLIPEIINYATRRSGVLAMGPTPVYAHVRSAPEEHFPDLQLAFRPFNVSFVNGRAKADPNPTVSAGFVNLRPEARGHLLLAAPDAKLSPRIALNYLTSEEDKRRMIAGFNWLRKIFSTPPMSIATEREIQPGASCRTEEQIFDYIRDNMRSGYHLAGSCQMGQGADAVVDHELRVRGVSNVRVVDASIMPRIVCGNINAPTMMIAERGAGMLTEVFRRGNRI
jgi:choline dehydrogenase